MTPMTATTPASSPAPATSTAPTAPLIIVYTGNGKGKTSACLGQALRAHGHGMRVCFAQFMKSDQQTGEQQFLQQLLQEDFFIGGKGFFTKEEQRPMHRTAAEQVLNWAQEKISVAHMLILDECLYALKSQLISQEEVTKIATLCQEHGVHLVLSGRGLPQWLIELAHIVSEIADIKHACKSGIPATKGIEF